MALREYERKRRFDITPEPTGAPEAAPAGNSFVVQKHSATNLHYDFRLELDGVLKSWAVPKGPSLDPTQRMLAIHVEDHPLAYASFEGTIPKGQYGGGTVMIWDRGYWTPIGDPLREYQRGEMKFHLFGEKLRGIWNLVRLNRSRTGKKNEWLLIKHGDEHARSAADYDIRTAEPRSVESGRDMDEIAAGKKPRRRRPSIKRAVIDPAAIAGVRRATQPEFLRPQLAEAADEAPTGDEWCHEIKLDGYRVLSVVREAQVRLFTRNANDWTAQFAAIAEAVRRLPIRNAILDGEVVVLNSAGASDFQALQNHMKSKRRSGLVYYLFDLPHYEGFDLTRAKLIDRRAMLAQVLSAAPDKRVLRFNDHIAGKGPETFQEICKLGLEGVVSKLARSPYESRRTRSWLKIKCKRSHEFVVGGFTDPEGSRTGFGALVLGHYDAAGNLIYCGRVGTGFDDATLLSIDRELRDLVVPSSPFKNLRRERKTHWIRPELVARVEFAGVSRDGKLRHPVFEGLMRDRPARSVTFDPPREHDESEPTEPAAVSKPVRVSSDHARITVGDVALSNPDRLYYPGENITKLDLARYYEAIADVMLPHVAGRPLMILRCPGGVNEKHFYQKHLNATFPGSFRGVDTGEAEPTLVLDDATALIAIAQLGGLEVHTWGCRADQLDAPDRIVFDLDPGPDVRWARVVESARLLRELLQNLKLESFAKLSGGKGIHVVVPIERRYGWEKALAFSKVIAEAFAQTSPSQYVAVMSKSRRSGRIFIDYFRNTRGATCIAAYSPRARPGAAVSVPVEWDELGMTATGDQFALSAVLDRVGRGRDPWRDLPKLRQRLPSRIG